MRYSIDSGALIDAWSRKYPRDIIPSLWEKMEESASVGDWCVVEEVVFEVKRGNDNLHEWVVSTGGAVLPSSEEIEREVARIVNRFPEFLPTRADDGIWADPNVIAAAQVHSLAVVTSELKAPPNAKAPKIPNICEELGLQCLTMLDFIRANGWRF